MKKVLILGGTQFIGRTLVEHLLKEEDFHLTLFNRQRTNAHFFPTVKKLKGDRETSDINQIGQENWDYVIDVSCYYPDALSQALKALAQAPRKYIFISTCSVYDNTDSSVTLRDENALLHSCTTAQAQNRENESYGPRKAACEQILAASGLSYVMFRPALVYGPYDHTDRLYYWLHQVRQNEELLLPDEGNPQFSLTYVRDLIQLILYSLKHDTPSKIYNAVTRPTASIQQIVETAAAILGVQRTTINAPATFLHQESVGQWSDLALWIDGDHFTYANQRIQHELPVPLTPFKKSLSETITYYAALKWPVPKFGMDEDRRLKLLNKLKG